MRTELPAGLPVPSSGEVNGVAVDPNTHEDLVGAVETSESDEEEELLAPITEEDLVNARFKPYYDDYTIVDSEMTTAVTHTTVTELRSSTPVHGPARVSAAVSAASSASLCLRSIMLYAVQAVLDLVPDFIFEEDLASFQALTAAELVQHFLTGMPKALHTYIDECLQSGRPWDMDVFVKLLHPRLLAKGKVGLYFIALFNAFTAFRTYTGVSTRLSQLRMHTRIQEHFSEKDRAAEKGEVEVAVQDLG